MWHEHGGRNRLFRANKHIAGVLNGDKFKSSLNMMAGDDEYFACINLKSSRLHFGGTLSRH
jgi:hypothetical protein